MALLYMARNIFCQIGDCVKLGVPKLMIPSQIVPSRIHYSLAYNMGPFKNDTNIKKMKWTDSYRMIPVTNSSSKYPITVFHKKNKNLKKNKICNVLKISSFGLEY